MRQGTGGAAGAAKRMGSSRVTGAQLLGLIGDVQRNGPVAALQRLNLGGLAGRPAVEVFLALTEVMCPPGGRVDEAIARQAMLDTICDMADQGVGDFGSLTADQLTEFFLGFVIHTIEGRVVADLGHRAIERPMSAEEAKLVQEDLHQFVDGHVRGHLGTLLDRVRDLPESEISGMVDRIYRASFELVSATAGDVE
ncbi:Qat anti-phage system associated protein QatB [Lysobacter panacisoli]|uniref:Qat anti-phage system associated protein QatB n=1 Tax=Lysobacter panacisoli TaxID=1255263 RepID=UPI00131AE889|nr:Qat anti-phage system associated protein QatB [Lysobacter panacisoli]